MAVSPHDTDEAFLREVDEGVRRETALKLWRRYGRIGVTVLVIGLAALAGWLWWRDQQVVAAGKAGEDLAEAISKLEVGEANVARPVFARLAKDGPGGYRGLAMLMQAADAVGAGNDRQAIALLDALAADKGQPQPLRDAALIKSVRLSFDTAPPATSIARLKELAVPGNAWFGIAGEMVAIAQVRAGKPEAAKPLLTAIVRDATQPASLRSRTAELAVSLGVDPQVLQPAAAAGAAPAAAKQG